MARTNRLFAHRAATMLARRRSEVIVGDGLGASRRQRLGVENTSMLYFFSHARGTILFEEELGILVKIHEPGSKGDIPW